MRKRDRWQGVSSTTDKEHFLFDPVGVDYLGREFTSPFSRARLESSLELLSRPPVLDEEEQNEDSEGDEPEGAGKGEIPLGGEVHGFLDVVLKWEEPLQFMSVL